LGTYYENYHFLGFANNRQQILAISIYCESSDVGETSFGKRAKVYPGKAPLQEILQAEVAGEHIEKKPIDNIDWDPKTLVEGELEPGKKTGRDGQLLITGELPSRSFLAWLINGSLWHRRLPR
jgi:hypothetical protein